MQILILKNQKLALNQSKIHSFKFLLSKIEFNIELTNNIVKYGCLQETSADRYMMMLNPDSSKCKKMFKKQPDFETAGERIESINVGLGSTYDKSYYTFLNYVCNSAIFKELYI